MYTNKCIKCGAEFETKNPKRVICPACLYADKKNSDSEEAPVLNSYSAQPEEEKSRERLYSNGGSYNNYRNNYNNRGGNYGGQRQPYGERRYQNNTPRPYHSQNGNNGQRPPKRFNNNKFQNGGKKFNGNRNFKRPSGKSRQLFVSKEQLEQIETLYTKALPLPNHDIHEVIGAALGIEPSKVFFGINLIRQKMMLPKIPFPKRKLAVTEDQLNAIKILYKPLLPLPPVGCHKIIAAQLKMDEWRVHVGIGLIRKQMGLDRWNSERTDIPEELKKPKNEQ